MHRDVRRAYDRSLPSSSVWGKGARRDSRGSEQLPTQRLEDPDTRRPYTPSSMSSAVQQVEQSRLTNLSQQW